MTRSANPPLVRPPALRPGDAVAVVAPSGPVSAAHLEAGAALLRSWGFDVRLMPSTRGGRGYLAGESDRAKGEEITACFADPEMRAVLCARGGYGAMRVLPFIDWHTVRANPKILCGYSDITALHQAFRREAGLVTLHGPLAARQNDEPELHPWTAAEFHRALTSTEPLGPIVPPPDAPPMMTVAGGQAEGPLAGGNLSLVAALAGTPWQLDARGCLLVLEDVNEAPYRVDRMLTQLLLAGILDGVRGVIFGDSPTCDRPADDPRTFPITTVLRDRLGPLGIPVLYGFPCGHTPLRATLPLGIRAALDATAQTVTVVEPASVVHSRPHATKPRLPQSLPRTATGSPPSQSVRRVE
jgi:muramoyltetrapeptide carboxypeptidase